MSKKRVYDANFKIQVVIQIPRLRLLEPSKVQKRDDLKVVRADLISEGLYKKNPADRVTRSLLRHDSAKLGECLLTKIFKFGS